MKNKQVYVLVATAVVCTLLYLTSDKLYGSEPAVKTLAIASQESVYSPKRFREEEVVAAAVKKKRLAVFLVSQCRSGSSIMGEVFNRRSNVAYFYEPLYPFRRSNCFTTAEDVTEESIRAVEDIAHCRFDELTQLYRRGYKVAKQADFVECIKHNICFVGVEKATKFITRDAPHLLDTKSKKVDMAALGEFCRSSDFVAGKLNYLRGIENITHLFDDADVQMKIVHLVRDPRATILSRFGGKAEHLVEAYDKISKHVCDRMMNNIDYADRNRLTTSRPQHFLRLRHEDFAVAPLPFVERLYDFIGVPPTPQLLKWFAKATSFSAGSDQNTQRDSRAVASAWRSKLDYRRVAVVQRNCRRVLDSMGYKSFDSETALKNMDVPSF